jgi:regulator of nucleoside diphosphate kinase
MNEASTGETHALPWIVVSEADRQRLSALALAAMSRVPDVATRLLAEMERAEVLAEDKLPVSVVRMGSTIEFVDDRGMLRRVTLVYPSEADISQGKVSVLTPVGAALVGLSVGQSITWSGVDGRLHRLTVLEVQPASDNAQPEVGHRENKG